MNRIQELRTIQLLAAVVFWSAISYSTKAQTTLTINGKLIDETTREPIAYALVGIDGSSYGAVSDEEGKFIIEGLPVKTHKLLISHIGFEPLVVNVDTKRASKEVAVRMRQKTVTLDEVSVTTKKGMRKRKRNLDRFKLILFGKGYQKKQISIANEEVLDFDDRLTNHLKSKKPLYLKIENRHLGYLIEYFKLSFDFNENRNWFRGNTRFTELEPNDENERKAWVRNRKAAYQGSIRHFFKSLIENRLEDEGFIVNLTNKNPQVNHFNTFVQETEPVVIGSGKNGRHNVDLSQSTAQSHYSVSFDKSLFLEILHVSKDSPVSHIRAEREIIRVYDSGVLVDPLEITNFGDYAVKGVYHMLPTNYQIND